MSKIIGEPIPDYVAYQINKRQAVHGKTSARTQEEITYLNSKTAWVKLASGISLNDARFSKENLRNGLQKDTLAKRYILFGGVARKDGKTLIQRGTNMTGTQSGIYDSYTGSYNVNAEKSSSQYGLHPMPGIISADIQCLNRGSIKKATLKIKCYTPEQFHVVDLLYLRIGYTMMLEWGNSVYLDNAGNLKKMGHTLIEANDGFFYQTDYYKMLPKIERYRHDKAGNYDGLISKVVNFSWSFAHDGSYDITLELISVGDVVESLKCNVVPLYESIKAIKQAYTDYVDSEGNPEELGTPQENPTNNIISAYLFQQKINLREMGVEVVASLRNRDVTLTYSGGQIKLGATKIEPATGTAALVSTSTAAPLHTNVVYFAYNNGELSDQGFYMRLGHLLEFIQNEVIPKNQKTKKPIIALDIYTGTNIMYTMPYQVSLDPRVCIVNGRELVNTKNYYHELDKWKIDGKEYAARTMNIYVNHNKINQLVTSNVDDRGNFNLYEFLKSLCTELNKALGGINRLEPVVDEDNHTITIIDQTYSPQVYPGSKYGLELYGYNPSFNSSNFIRNMSLKTEISSDFATMATIGSTAGGYVKGTENTMFSKWNRGIVDRYKEQYTVKDKTPDEMLEDVRKVYLEEFWKQRSAAFGMKVDGDNVTLDDNIIDNNISNGTEFFKAVYAKMQRTKPQYASPSAGFVPINLGVTMDGLAGFKIYNSLSVSTKFLPKNYGNNLHFIIKGVNHKLSDNDWETTLETVVIANSSK